MKNLSLIILSALLIFTAGSCRKGDDDPFFSFISRQNRAEGTWILKQGNSEASISQNGTTSSAAYIMTEDSITTTMQGQTFTQQYTEYIEFIEDGTYSLSTSQEYGPGYSAQSVITGTWEFMEKSDGYKNKERIELIPDTQIQTIGPNSTELDLSVYNYNYVLYISRLSKDELELDFEYSLQQGDADVSAGGSKKYEKE